MRMACAGSNFIHATVALLPATDSTTVTIFDVNEVPVFLSNPYTVAVNENVPVNTLVGSD